MLLRIAVGLVSWCWRRAGVVVAAFTLLTVASAWYAAGHLGLDTDESKLISADQPFRQAEKAFAAAFPGGGGDLVVVVDAATVGQAEDGVRRLKAALDRGGGPFLSVDLPPGTDFFARNGLLYLSPGAVQALADTLVTAQPLIGSLAADPSLRGLLKALDLAAEGIRRGDADPAQFEPALHEIAGAAADPSRPLAWRRLVGLGEVDPRPPRALLLVTPRLDYGSLTPGRPAAEAIRRAAAGLGLTRANGYAVRLTGQVALSDDNFATVAEGVEISTPLSIAAVTVLLVLAVRSRRAAAAILLALVAGLALTAAFAAAAVGTLNPISVAFAVLFVGIAVDFGIQFTIRLRDEQTRAPDRAAAVAATASAMAGPLSLAALATAVGFLSFLPTAYAGVAQLGLIAGVGMLIALVVCLTLLPALLGLLRPPPARDVVGLRLARPLERWLHRHARAVVVAALAAAAIGAGLSPWLHFDFNPLNLQNPRSESVRAFRDLASQPETSPYAIDALAPSLDAADEMGRRFDRLPEVDHTITLTDLIPEQQDAKLAVLADLQMLLGPTLAAGTPPPPPTAAELAGRLADTAGRLRGASPAATELADRLGVVAASGPQAVERFAAAVTAGLPALLDDLRHMLDARPVTRASLPPELARRWIAADGRARIEVVPKGDMQDEKALTRFVAAVEAVDPEVSGAPVSIVAAGRTVITAFAEAGLIALTAITGLLLAVLRRPGDVALVLLPLALGALYTVVGAVAGGLAINFANIICLPLLLGIGVAFSIYFVLNRRRGLRRPLSAATGRAVLYSALTTGSAFGSLGLSPHRGTASMGLLLFLALGLAVATVFLVLPAVFAVIERRGRGSSAPGR